MTRYSLVFAAVMVLAAESAAAQQADVRARLSARNVDASLADAVAAVAADAAGQNLPTAPLVDKTLEGWAKHAPPDRILAAVRQSVTRMAEARQAALSAGMTQPPPDVVAAGAEALGRGMRSDQITSIVRADDHASTAVGLRVASALAAQGMAMNDAVAVVTRSMRARQRPREILDLPSTMRALQAQGMSAPDIGRHFLRDGDEGGDRPVSGQPLPPGGTGVRPPREGPSPEGHDRHHHN